MDDFVSKGELLRRLHNGYKEFNEGIKRLSPEQMETPWFTYCSGRDFACRPFAGDTLKVLPLRVRTSTSATAL
ncbi:hypothetical protein [Paenibacillus sp. Soil787]|uniref:hypothetical protein n=1 Tax=Paenibacillus sp. Soil787 TaxID=1736411 RepID=UPI0007028CFC|nr:hypothetical protein [Paenibacillus sp. Soil787]KRF18410.1 hypothetical protein ASG93_10125 [Paenibacillus sp. Soil787]